MEDDERFKDLAKDPRFRALRKPKDVQIDERFQSMFTDEKFIPKTRDKRGYDEGEESEEVSSSSSDESESDEEEDQESTDHLNVENLEYDWQALDDDAERADEISKRIAIMHMDWDRLDVRDIYTLVNSIRPPKRVRIYVSEFGKERLKQEEIEGPRELLDRPNLDEEEEEEFKMLEGKMKAMDNPKANPSKANEYEDADEALDPKNFEMRERIRKYQLSRMKYYYAIVDFDSSESAEAVYKELDGMEYEGSSLELDLRFVPDDIEFDDSDMRAECDKLPDITTYKAPQFINTALQQTTVKLSWDETDLKRQEKLHRAYTKEELDKDDFEEFLASDDEDDDDDDDDDDEGDGEKTKKKDSSNKYQELLKSLDEEEGNKKKVDVEVNWDEGEDDSDSDSCASSSAPSSSAASSSSSSSSAAAATEVSQSSSSRRSAPTAAPVSASASADLDLLLMNDTNKKEEEFEFNPEDDRFKAVYTSQLYNIDPSHPNFKRTKAFDMIAERKRRKTRES